MISQTQLQPIPEVHSSVTAPKRIVIGQAFVDVCSFDEAILAITALALAGSAPAYVVTPNAQHIVLLARDPRLREIYRQADLVVPDGVSLLIAARCLGTKFPERVSGVDLFEALCSSAARTGLRVFLLGGRPGSAELAASVLKELFSGLQVDTHCPPPGFETSETELDGIHQKLNIFRPHFLFVALGAPKQEYWIYDHGRKSGVPVCIGVGGSFEMIARVVPRAPRWIQGVGCEWMYRLCREPRRMWRRYLIGNFQFAYIIMRQAFARRAQPETTGPTAAGDSFS